MNTFLEILSAHINQHPPTYGDQESILEMCNECHNENRSNDNEQPQADSNEQYQQTNGIPS